MNLNEQEGIILIMLWVGTILVRVSIAISILILLITIFYNLFL